MQDIQMMWIVSKQESKYKNFPCLCPSVENISLNFLSEVLV